MPLQTLDKPSNQWSGETSELTDPPSLDASVPLLAEMTLSSTSQPAK